MSGLAALGAFVALPVSGYWVLNRLKQFTALREELPLVTVLALCCALGLVLWLGLLLPLALANHYMPPLVGSTGWLLVAYGAISFRQKPRLLPDFLERDRWFLLLLLVTAAVYLGFPTQSIYGGRDEGVYANHGIYLATHGRAAIEYPWPKNLNILFSATWQRFPGFLATIPAMTAQFPIAFSIWLGQAYASVGHHGLFGLNGVLGLLSAAVFYGLARQFMPVAYALAASLLFALNPAQIWIARITLAEIFAQLIIWSGILLLVLALKRSNKNLARVGGFLIGVVPLIRLDGFILLPLLLLAHFLYKILNKAGGDNRNEVWWSSNQVAIPFFILSFVYYVLADPFYYLAHGSIVAPAGIAAAFLLFVLLLLPGSILDYLKNLIGSRPWLVFFSLVVVALAIYAYWIRPHLGPFSYIPGLGDGQQRGYRENTLVNLAYYVSLPVVWAAIAGWLLLAWRSFRETHDIALILVWVIVGGSAMVYLYEPNVSPDHYWAIRRFVPVVIPGFILFAVYAVSRMLTRLPSAYAKLGYGLILLFFVSIFARTDFRLFGVTEYKGIYHQLASLAAKLPEDALILVDGPPLWVTPLYVAFNKKVIPIELTTEAGAATLSSWMDLNRTKEKPIYILLLRTNKNSFPSLPASELNKAQLVYSYVERTIHPLPKVTVEERTEARLLKLNLTTSFLNYAFGGTKSPLIKESGFLGEESNDGGPFRWTAGQAMLEVPVDKLPRQIQIKFIAGPLAATKLKILFNGQTVFNEAVGSGEGSKILKLPAMGEGRNVNITLLSDTFTPVQFFPGSMDARVLGIAIREIILR